MSDTNGSEAPSTSVPQIPLSRDEARAAIFTSREPQKREVIFNGVKIEIRQPLLSDIIAARDQGDENSAIVNTLVMYAFLPGTDIKVFEPGDAQALLAMPFGASFADASKAITEMTNVSFPEVKPDSKGTNGSTP